ncbi:uncharacterized protein LOC100829514 [Brachypodium distachyon]|uniref:DUF599 domain-containing protein n=1 Tax=Brachypodium distachyon TaxID=15368 RepID=I1I8L3_BRADI|nr:uncharacterized protein LOC100829514 [Brachypodium distachyon]KQJ98988.1 hypothetical protein BRADI_3g40382v3 [Brachypodium distachyon]|eukprot:XP_003574775.1 uncharacterized protein LOC100829514 [Brachypodium distachyon]
MVAWRDSYLDLVLIPVGLLFPILYHVWLYRAVRRCPLRSTAGIGAAARRLWVLGMMRDNEKKAVLVVQSLRNVIMGSTLVATTSVLFCTGVAAVLSSTYAVKKPLSDAVFGAHGEYMVALKYATLLLAFLLSFLCHSLAICSLNQAAFLVNALSSQFFVSGAGGGAGGLSVVDKEYVVEVLERGFVLSLVGNRLFFGGVPLLLWIFGPVLACLASMLMIPVLYNIDIVYVEKRKGSGEVAEMATTDADDEDSDDNDDNMMPQQV